MRPGPTLKPARAQAPRSPGEQSTEPLAAVPSDLPLAATAGPLPFHGVWRRFRSNATGCNSRSRATLTTSSDARRTSCVTRPKRGSRGDPRPCVDVAPRSAGTSALCRNTSPRPSRQAPPDSRRIPAAVKREVWKRDGGRCAFVGSKGRCRSGDSSSSIMSSPTPPAEQRPSTTFSCAAKDTMRTKRPSTSATTVIMTW